MSDETVEDARQGNGATEDGFDVRLARLEEIVTALEEGGLELEPAIERYKEGVALLKGCRALLGTYRKQVEELSRESESGVRPYSGDPDLAEHGG